MNRLTHITVLLSLTLFLSACNENWGKDDYIYPPETELQDPMIIEQLVYNHNQLSFKYKVMENVYGIALLFLIEASIVAIYLYHINVEDKKKVIQLKEKEAMAYVRQLQEAQNLISVKQHKISGLTHQLLHGNKLKLVDQLVSKTEELHQLKTHPQKLSPDRLQMIERVVNLTFDNYVKRLTVTIPTLTDSELTLCTLIKLGLNVKEIATVISIEPTSVSRRKLRIKDKVAAVAGSFDAKRTIDQWLRDF